MILIVELIKVCGYINLALKFMGGKMFQDALEEIREAMPAMTPQQQKVGQYFCEHPEKIGYLTMAEFADNIGLSAPTVNRFCQTMGYKGFLDFSRKMATLRENQITHISYFHNAKIQRAKSKESSQLARILAKKETANINKLIENFPADKIAASVKLMKESSTISVLGRMSAYPAAIYFEQLLSKITSKVYPMNGADVMQAATFSRMNSSNLVFCIAFPRYPRIILELARKISKKGASIIAITNDNNSPLAKVCDILFTVDVDIFSYIDLFAPVFTLINIICMQFSLEQCTQSEDNLEKYDMAAEDVFLHSNPKLCKKIEDMG